MARWGDNYEKGDSDVCDVCNEYTDNGSRIGDSLTYVCKDCLLDILCEIHLRGKE